MQVAKLVKKEVPEEIDLLREEKFANREGLDTPVAENMHKTKVKDGKRKKGSVVRSGAREERVSANNPTTQLPEVKNATELNVNSTKNGNVRDIDNFTSPSAAGANFTPDGKPSPQMTSI